SQPGWDGEYGPFFDRTNVGVNYCSLDRADYISNAMRGTFAANAALASIDSDELIQRMECLRLCIESLPRGGNEVNTTSLWLVQAEKIGAMPPTDAPLTGEGYLYTFVLPAGDPIPDPAELRRLCQPTKATYLCRVTTAGLRWSSDGGASFEYVSADGV